MRIMGKRKLELYIFFMTMVFNVSNGQPEFGSLDLGDMNGNGHLDLLFCNNAGNGIAGIGENDGQGRFVMTGQPAYPLATSVGWADLNNDGWPDYYMFGSGPGACHLYMNNGGDGTFARSGQFEERDWLDPDVTVVDDDNDGDRDLFVTGWDVAAARRYSKIFRNDGKGTFTETDLNLIQKGFGSASWADVDHNCTLDLLLNGDGDAYGDGGSYDIYRLYINQGDGVFTRKQEFGNYRQISVGDGSRFADWDNDGDFDIILTGWSNTENRQATCLFLNDGTGTFSRSPESDLIPGVSESSIEVADLNRDGRIDLLLTGYSGDYGRQVALIYLNDTEHSNTRPEPPVNLQTEAGIDSVTFAWEKGSDPETPADALTYHFYLKDITNDRWIIHPGAETGPENNGRRMVSGMGNACLNRTWMIRDLPEGKYAWSVQTVDAIYAGSVFPPGVIFAVKDTALLRDLVRQAEELVRNAEEGTGVGQYPPGAVNRLQDSIDRVEPLIDSMSVTREEIEVPLLAALEVFNGSRTGVDISALEAVIREAVSITDTVVAGEGHGDYPGSALDTLLAAVSHAEAVVSEAGNITEVDEIEPMQGVVDGEVSLLGEAIGDFLGQRIIIDFSLLEEAIDSAIRVYDISPSGYENGLYPPEAKLELALAIEAGMALKTSDPSMQQVDAGIITLHEAIADFLEKVVVVDFETLGTLIDSATVIHDTADVAGYLPGAKFDLKKAITRAEQVYGNPSATRQEVEDAIGMLETAITEFLASRLTSAAGRPARGIVVYPIPATSQLFIDGIRAGDRIEILGASGRRMVSSVSEGNRISLDLSGLKAGLYLVRITGTTGEQHSRKILIQSTGRK